MGSRGLIFGGGVYCEGTWSVVCGIVIDGWVFIMVPVGCVLNVSEVWIVIYSNRVSGR